MSGPRWRRLGAELRHPFRDSGLAVRDLACGSRVLAGRAADWVLTPETWKERGERVLGVVAGAALGCWVVSRYLVVGLPLAMGVWFVAASVFAPHRPGAPARPVNATKNDQENSGEQHPEALDNQLHLYVEHALAGAKRTGHHGVHLSTLLAGLHRHGHLADWTVTDLGAQLRRMGIPVRDVRVGKTNRVGVYHLDLQKHLGRAPRTPPHLVPDLTPPDPADQAPAAVP